MSSTNTLKATVLEAAFIAGIKDRDMNRFIDESILPEELFEIKNGRFFGPLACVFASFYMREQRLSKPARLEVVKELTRRIASVGKATGSTFFSSSLELDSWVVDMDLLSVNIAKYVSEVRPRIEQISKVDGMVSIDENVLGGEPVFSGTRVPVRTIAAWVDSGESHDAIKKSFPSVSNEMIDAAPLWVKTHPQRGRPKSFGDLNPEWKIVSKKRVSLTDA